MDFDDFLDQRLGHLARLAVVLCGNRASGEDVLQEVLMRAHQLWPRISATQSPYGYVRTMLVHEHLAWCRKWDRQIPTAAVDTGRWAPDPAVRVTDRADLRDRLNALPPQQRAAVVLRYFADLPDTDIAQALDCTPVTVRSHISRALSAMRVALDSELAQCSPSGRSTDVTPTTYTTQDLRDSLQETADSVGDLSEWRQRLDDRLADAMIDEPGDFVPVIGGSTVAPIRKERRVWSSRTAQIVTGAVLAACIAALAFVVIRAPWHSSPEQTTAPLVLPTPDPHVKVPADLRSAFTPGSTPLRNFAGTGTQRIYLGALVKVPNHTYWLYYTCSTGDIRITYFAGSSCGKGHTSGFGGNPGTHRHVRVFVGPGVRWHLLLVLQTDPDNNAPGLLSEGGPHPAATARSHVLGNGRNGWAKSGHGDRVFSIPSITRPSHIAVEITCSGSGVRISTLDGQIDNDYTKTCWPGYIIQWQQPALRSPTLLFISAPANTKWVISIGQD